MKNLLGGSSSEKGEDTPFRSKEGGPMTKSMGPLREHVVRAEKRREEALSFSKKGKKVSGCFEKGKDRSLARGGKTVVVTRGILRISAMGGKRGGGGGTMALFLKKKEKGEEVFPRP